MSRRLEFDALPSLMGQYLRAVVPGRRRAHESGEQLPISASARDIRVDRERLDAYRDLCALPHSSHLPVTYPQVLATPLHAAIIAAPEFPFPALGLVHMSNDIVQHRAIPSHAPLDLEARFDTTREVPRGAEFEIKTQARFDGEHVWESVIKVLVRHKSKMGPSQRKKRAPGPPGDEPARARSVILRVPEDTGRRYAAVSGDYNPIHLHAASARIFGFRRAIVQGMWSLARCTGELADDMPGEQLRLNIDFKRPIELPSRLLFSSATTDGGLEFAMRSHDAAKLYLSGTVNHE